MNGPPCAFRTHTYSICSQLYFEYVTYSTVPPPPLFSYQLKKNSSGWRAAPLARSSPQGLIWMFYSFAICMGRYARRTRGGETKIKMRQMSSARKCLMEKIIREALEFATIFFYTFFYRDFQRGKVSTPPPALLQLARCYSQAFLTAFHGFLQGFFFFPLPTTRNILNNVVYLISFNSGGSLRNVFDSRPEGAGVGAEITRSSFLPNTVSQWDGEEGTTIVKMKKKKKNPFFERFLLIKYKPDDSGELRSGVGGICETRTCPAFTADLSGVT